jgi:hypothetical protein
MSRFGLAFALASVVLVGSASVARAQALGQGPPMPLAVDLAKVPVGSYADYTMTVGAGMASMKSRMALVARTPAANILETSVEGGMLGPSGKMAVQMTIAPGTDATPTKMVTQIGAADPMEIPPALTGKPFTKPNPKTLVGTETIKVPAGSFKAKHYRDKTPQGDKIDYWVTDSVLPLGLVKVEAEQPKSTAQVKGKVMFELAGTGKDAKQLITKPPKPFDQAALLQQMMALQSAAGAGAKPGAAAPPPPPPAKK